MKIVLQKKPTEMSLYSRKPSADILKIQQQQTLFLQELDRDILSPLKKPQQGTNINMLTLTSQSRFQNKSQAFKNQGDTNEQSKSNALLNKNNDSYDKFKKRNTQGKFDFEQKVTMNLKMIVTSTSDSPRFQPREAGGTENTSQIEVMVAVKPQRQPKIDILNLTKQKEFLQNTETSQRSNFLIMKDSNSNQNLIKQSSLQAAAFNLSAYKDFKNTKTSVRKEKNKDVEDFIENQKDRTKSSMSILINGNKYISDHQGSMVSNSQDGMPSILIPRDLFTQKIHHPNNQQQKIQRDDSEIYLGSQMENYSELLDEQTINNIVDVLFDYEKPKIQLHRDVTGCQAGGGMSIATTLLDQVVKNQNKKPIKKQFRQQTTIDLIIPEISQKRDNRREIKHKIEVLLKQNRGKKSVSLTTRKHFNPMDYETKHEIVIYQKKLIQKNILEGQVHQILQHKNTNPPIVSYIQHKNTPKKKILNFQGVQIKTVKNTYEANIGEFMYASDLATPQPPSQSLRSRPATGTKDISLNYRAKNQSQLGTSVNSDLQLYEVYEKSNKKKSFLDDENNQGVQIALNTPELLKQNSSQSISQKELHKNGAIMIQDETFDTVPISLKMQKVKYNVQQPQLVLSNSNSPKGSKQFRVVYKSIEDPNVLSQFPNILKGPNSPNYSFSDKYQNIDQIKVTTNIKEYLKQSQIQTIQNNQQSPLIKPVIGKKRAKSEVRELIKYDKKVKEVEGLILQQIDEELHEEFYRQRQLLQNQGLNDNKLWARVLLGHSSRVQVALKQIQNQGRLKELNSVQGAIKMLGLPQKQAIFNTEQKLQKEELKLPEIYQIEQNSKNSNFIRSKSTVQKRPFQTIIKSPPSILDMQLRQRRGTLKSNFEINPFGNNSEFDPTFLLNNLQTRQATKQVFNPIENKLEVVIMNRKDKLKTLQEQYESSDQHATLFGFGKSTSERDSLLKTTYLNDDTELFKAFNPNNLKYLNSTAQNGRDISPQNFQQAAIQDIMQDIQTNQLLSQTITGGKIAQIGRLKGTQGRFGFNSIYNQVLQKIKDKHDQTQSSMMSIISETEQIQREKQMKLKLQSLQKFYQIKNENEQFQIALLANTSSQQYDFNTIKILEQSPPESTDHRKKSSIISANKNSSIHSPKIKSSIHSPIKNSSQVLIEAGKEDEITSQASMTSNPIQQIHKRQDSLLKIPMSRNQQSATSLHKIKSVESLKHGLVYANQDMTPLIMHHEFKVKLTSQKGKHKIDEFLPIRHAVILNRRQQDMQIKGTGLGQNKTQFGKLHVYPQGTIVNEKTESFLFPIKGLQNINNTFLARSIGFVTGADQINNSDSLSFREGQNEKTREVGISKHPSEDIQTRVNKSVQKRDSEMTKLYNAQSLDENGDTFNVDPLIHSPQGILNNYELILGVGTQTRLNTTEEKQLKINQISSVTKLVISNKASQLSPRGIGAWQTKETVSQRARGLFFIKEQYSNSRESARLSSPKVEQTQQNFVFPQSIELNTEQKLKEQSNNENVLSYELPPEYQKFQVLPSKVYENFALGKDNRRQQFLFATNRV